MTYHTGFKDPADHPIWREFTSAERAQLQEGSPVFVLIPGEDHARTARFLRWSRWAAKILYDGETGPDFVGPFSLGTRR
ncbi:MAG TPA: hypothetical protein VGD78_20035 [Chthoniobacterales bacterium]